MSFNSGWVPEHYISSTVNSTYNTLGNAVPQTPTTDRRANRYTNCPTTLCLYTNPDGWECLELINCGDASDHFRDVHRIVGLAREVRLVFSRCSWKGVPSIGIFRATMSGARINPKKLPWSRPPPVIIPQGSAVPGFSPLIGKQAPEEEYRSLG
ncbi:hypothetical protein F5J12DRAFT_781844 [Pisolithus orientalis]|uniref:uncharacterized protein n=1 Tax=Pisolithus orientalis TaxID=936130 RepID=UPI00222574D2|nr:uncharacterized protein F5J12DRAFT_781844 [Pisolithus orientalis]KAI6010871.1 hypothetical protein F5J12DRAFT_781844 [Pisolithus orientalis]